MKQVIEQVLRMWLKHEAKVKFRLFQFYRKNQGNGSKGKSRQIEILSFVVHILEKHTQREHRLRLRKRAQEILSNFFFRYL